MPSFEPATGQHGGLLKTQLVSNQGQLEKTVSSHTALGNFKVVKPPLVPMSRPSGSPNKLSTGNWGSCSPQEQAD